MQLTTENFLAKLDDLATISPVAVELIHKLGDIDTPRQEIVKLTESDEVIYANLFKYIKSATFSFRAHPSGTQHAIEILGQHGLRDLIFVITARKVFLNLGLWQKSLLSAFFAKAIAERHGYDPRYASDIYIATLMCNFGQMVFKTFYPQQYSEIKLDIPYLELLAEEKRIFGINSLDLSCEIAKTYKMPTAIIQIIASQGLPLTDSNFSQVNTIIYTALSIVNAECLDYHDIEETIDRNLLKAHKLEALEFNSWLIFECKKLAEAFNGA